MRGMLAAYDSEAALLGVVDRLHAAGLSEIEVFSPIGLAQGETPWSLIPSLVLAGGVIGAGFAFGVETLATATSWGYPIDIGGRPAFSWPAYMPIAVAFGLLCAGVAALIGYLLHSAPWRLWAPEDEFAAMPGASRDRWIVHVQSEDDEQLSRVRAILGATGAIAMRPVSPDLEDMPA